MNDSERKMWVINDEGLYNMYKCWKVSNTGGIAMFIRTHRKIIDRLSGNVMSGDKKYH